MLRKRLKRESHDDQPSGHAPALNGQGLDS